MTTPCCYFCGGRPWIKTVHTGNGSVDVCIGYLSDEGTHPKVTICIAI
jgi:hypothetical protein